MNETLTRTICITLDAKGHDTALAETQRCFNEAASWLATVCWEERITNSNTAHHRVYGQTRARFGLGAQLAICARAKAMEAIKSIRRQETEKLARWGKANARRQRTGKKPLPPPEPARCPQFGPRASIRYDARTYRLLSLDRVSLNTLEGRITARLRPAQRQHEMLCDPDWRVGGAEVVWRNGTYFLHVTQSKEAPALTPAEEAIGIDLGLVNILLIARASSSRGSRCGRNAVALWVAVPLCNGWELVRPNGVSSR